MTVFLLILVLQTPGALRSVEEQLARAERAELREPGSDRFFTLDSASLARARSQIEAYLQTSPDDAAAWVLLARVGRFVLQPTRSAQCSPEHGCVLDSTFNDAPFRAALDSALKLRPDDPAAHFWKARLLGDGRPVLHNGEFGVDVDTAQMLVHARRAVALDSRSVRYREFLAVTLSEMGSYEEAAEAIRPVDGGKHILSLIFQDLAAVPVPERAVAWPKGHAVLAAVGLHESPRFAGQAGRRWVTEQSIDQVEAFYRRRWPSFRFFRSVAENGQHGGMQYLRPDRQGKLQPAADSAFMTELANESQFIGLLLAVGQSGPRFDRPGARYPAAVAGKDVFSEIIIVTGRKGN
ncbi:MAG TPA: hypothetical protein VJ755_05165 [Gemmatimonadales bacterium]|nr:hypothetical protein [Gemmatimonadales bacterium]